MEALSTLCICRFGVCLFCKRRTIFTTHIRQQCRDIPRVCPQRRTIRKMHPHDTINRYAHIHGELFLTQMTQIYHADTEIRTYPWYGWRRWAWRWRMLFIRGLYRCCTKRRGAVCKANICEICEREISLEIVFYVVYYAMNSCSDIRSIKVD